MRIDTDRQPLRIFIKQVWFVPRITRGKTVVTKSRLIQVLQTDSAMKFSTNTRTYWKRKNRCNTTEMRELPYQSLTSGRYCARYNSNRRDGLAIHTSSKQFAMAITIRCAHRSGFMVVGGRTKSLRVYRVKKNKRRNFSMRQHEEDFLQNEEKEKRVLMSSRLRFLKCSSIQ